MSIFCVRWIRSEPTPNRLLSTTIAISYVKTMIQKSASSPRRLTKIREVLIHGNYMSQKDIEICVKLRYFKFKGV